MNKLDIISYILVMIVGVMVVILIQELINLN